MKLKFGLLLSLLNATIAYAVTPDLMSYQGRVSDSTGALIGATTPVNRLVTFKFYSSPTDSTVIYAESQTVTISGGEFSVLIGNGTGLTSLPGLSLPASPLISLPNALNGTNAANVYLGITVDDGNPNTVDTEISPRQQLVTGAYAMRAKVAETVATNGITSTMILGGAVGTSQIAASAIDSSRILDASVGTLDIAPSAITAAKLDTATVGLWTPDGTSNVYRASGNVGIAQSSPAFPLSFASALGDKISLWGTSSSHYGFGIQGGLLQIHTDGASSDVAFGYGSSSSATSLTETMRIKGDGTVGIGTTTPGAKLHVNNGNVLVKGTSQGLRVANTDTTAAYVDLGMASGSTGTWSTSAANKDGVLRSTLGKLILQSGVGAAGLTLDTANYVGIGTSAPVSRFNISEASGTAASSGSGTITLDHENTGGANSIVFRSKNNRSSDYAYIQYQDDTAVGGTSEASRLIISNENDITTDHIILAPNGGRVGIGTMNPVVPLHVAGATTNNFASDYYFIGNGGHDDNSASKNESHSIVAEGGIQVGIRIDISSDQRIKTVQQISDGKADLDTLLGIKVTDYHYKDQVRNPDVPQKKVIAQQVESVFPQAVSKSVGVVPDIFQKATIRNNRVSLSTDLKVGDKVRLLSDKGDAIHKVLEVQADGFLTDLKAADGPVFVYGREVNDFRSVDYDALSMLNVSATQQIKKEKDAEVKALQDKVTALEARLNALEKFSAAK